MNLAIDRKTILETLLENAGQLMNDDLLSIRYDWSIGSSRDPERRASCWQTPGTRMVSIIIQFTEGRYTRDRAIGEVSLRNWPRRDRVQPKFGIQPMAEDSTKRATASW
jgi:hypothetical protein